MSDYKGKIGVIIITLSVVIGIFVGYALNVTTDTTTDTRYDYVTDVSGLFDYDKTPMYVDYDVNLNYSGYTEYSAGGVPTGNGSGITYYETTQPNAYIIGQTSASGNGTTNLKTESMIVTDLDNDSFGIVSINGFDHSLYQSVRNYYSVDKFVSVKNYVASIGLPASTTTVTLSIDNSADTNFVGFTSLSERNNTTILYQGDGYTIKEYGTRGYSHNPIKSGTSGAVSDTFSITYDILNDKITYISWRTPGAVVLSGSEYGFVYGSGNTEILTIYQKIDSQYTDTTLSKSLTATVSYAYSYSTPTYMEVNRGITITPSAGAVSRWSNGYDNGEIDIVLHAEDNGTTYSNDLTLSTGDTIHIVRGADLHTLVTVNADLPVDVGVWASYVLTINASSGIITVTPIDIFANYTTFTLFDYTFSAGTINPGAVTYIDWDAGNSFGVTVYKTKVFLNTYSAVMHDPSIVIDDYFDLSFMKIVFRSFALYGESMTINGQSYYGGADNQPIRDTGAIYVNDTQYSLQNLGVIYYDGHTYLSIDKDTIDLGETVNKTVSMTGLWYFTTELYEGNTVTKTVYDWHPDVFSIDMSGLAILVVALLLLGLILARRFFSESMTATDYILIFGAMLFFIALIGGIVQ